jgi:multiple sugar transport system permease protein
MGSRPGLSPANAPAATGPAGRLDPSIGPGAVVDPSPGSWFTAPLDEGCLLDCAAVGRRSTLWRQALAVLVTVLFVAPLVLMLSGSLRQAGLPPPRVPELIPSPLAFENYSRAFELVDIPRYALNSLIVAAIAVPLSVLVASWAGFAMARLPRREANALVAVSLIALMVPLTALLVPRFTLFRALGLTDTYVPLVAPALLGMSPFYVLLYYWAFRRVPPELFDAARLEGLSAFAAWRRVAMPLVRPVTVAVAVLAFTVSWSNFLDPLIYLYDERLFTLPLGLKSLAQLDRLNFPLLLAGAVAATAPVVAAFIFVQRYFLKENRLWHVR